MTYKLFLNKTIIKIFSLSHPWHFHTWDALKSEIPVNDIMWEHLAYVLAMAIYIAMELIEN